MAIITLNPSDMGTGNVLSNGNLTVTNTAVTGVRATEGKTTGKWYWEVKLDSGSIYFFLGIANKNFPLSSASVSDTNYRGVFWQSGNKYPVNATYSSAIAVGNVIGVALDLDNSTLTFYKNGVSQGVAFTDLNGLGEVFPLLKSNDSLSKVLTFNFGATAFTYPIPSGYKAYYTPPLNKILLSSGNDKVKKVNIKEKALNNAVPKMTSDIAPSGVTSASSTFDTTYLAWKAFNGLGTNDGWMTPSGVKTGWLAYEFVNPVGVYKYSILGRTITLTASPKDWTFEGSNDSTNWTVLDTQIGVSGWVADTYKEFTFENNKLYKKYRINITSNDGHANYISISEFNMFISNGANKITSIPNKSEQSFINHGMNQSDLASIDMYADFTEKHYIQDESTVLGSGKVFEHTLDVNKVLKKIKVN